MYKLPNSPRAQEALDYASEEVKRLKRTFVGSEHLLLGILKLRQGFAPIVLEMMSVDPDALIAKIESRLQTSDLMSDPGEARYSLELYEVLNLAERDALELESKHIGTEHMLLGMLKDPTCGAAKTLASFGISLAKAREVIIRIHSMPEYLTR